MDDFLGVLRHPPGLDDPQLYTPIFAALGGMFSEKGVVNIGLEG